MGDDFALAGVFGAVARVEEAAADGDEGIVKVADHICIVSITWSLSSTLRQVRTGRGVYLRLEKPIAMSINSLNRLVVGYTNMVRLDAHQGPHLLVQLVNHLVSVPLSTHLEQPYVGELRGKWRGDVAEVSVCYKVWIQKVKGG